MNNSAIAAFIQHIQLGTDQGLRQMIKALPIAIAIIVTNGLVFFLFYRRKSLRIKSNYLRLGLLFEAGRLLTFSAFRMGAYSRWGLIRGWVLIRINAVRAQNMVRVIKANIEMI